MKVLFDTVSLKCSRITTHSYSTSFSLGIRLLNKKFHAPIYSIYGFVRFADEIVDSFHDFNKESLLRRFREDTYTAIHEKIALNPILNSFQHTVHQYGIEHSMIDTFLKSMEMDLYHTVYNRQDYQTYIVGSAEVVGLMCLKVFCNGNTEAYESLKDSAIRLGAAFQKINFLRDMKADYTGLGRTYFPEVNMEMLDETNKKKIEEEISNDFHHAYRGIKKLPRGARLGVYIAYLYYHALLKKIRAMPPSKIMKARIRISNQEKYALFASAYVKHQFNLI